ncbi:hypothetical protein BDW22DRAFT_1058766 [Trametopsis cervina]|nr:hypothetical protein BDW22DRAFT_1058766 [Trametopsis cervina]
MRRRTSSPTANSRWLAMSLSAILSAPHPAFPKSPNVHTGPGPADLFSIRFDEMFQSEAHGYICGREVDREELKNALLGLHTRWDPEDATAIGTVVRAAPNPMFLDRRCSACQPTMSAKLEFTPLFRYPREVETIMAEASGQEFGGSERIECLRMDGDESLFRPESL